MADTECPYCGADVEINHDDGYGYEEDRIHQQECRSCEKSFVFTTCISFDYSPKKADCLNGGEHTYQKTKTYPPRYAVMECSTCGDRRPLDHSPKSDTQ
jgi:hypothetical protein